MLSLSYQDEFIVEHLKRYFTLNVILKKYKFLDHDEDEFFLGEYIQNFFFYISLVLLLFTEDIIKPKSIFF